MPRISNFLKLIKSRGLQETLVASFNHALASGNRVIGNKYLKKKIYNYEMFLDLYDRGISRALILFGNRELEHKYILEKVLREGMNVLDIGANIGYYALMELKLIGDSGRLIAVEPSSSNIALLKRNLELNNYNKIEIHEAAISDEDSIKEFHLSHMSNLNTFHATGSGKQFLSGETVNVKTMTVETVLSGRNINLIRMDVEGHEVEILNGLVRSFNNIKTKPMIIFETHLSRYGEEHDFRKTLSDLFKLGYRNKYVGSSSQEGTNRIKSFGYSPLKEINSDGDKRCIFQNLNNEDIIELACNKGGIRTILLCHEN